jgi:hypothetical protein
VAAVIVDAGQRFRIGPVSRRAGGLHNVGAIHVPARQPLIKAQVRGAAQDDQQFVKGLHRGRGAIGTRPTIMPKEDDQTSLILAASSPMPKLPYSAQSGVNLVSRATKSVCHPWGQIDIMMSKDHDGAEVASSALLPVMAWLAHRNRAWGELHDLIFFALGGGLAWLILWVDRATIEL